METRIKIITEPICAFKDLENEINEFLSTLDGLASPHVALIPYGDVFYALIQYRC